MTIIQSSENEKNILSVEGALLISNIAALLDEFKSKINFDQPMEVDLSRVDQIDTAGAQLLAAVVKECNQIDKEITWTGITPELEDTIEQLGLDLDQLVGRLEGK
jgi:anti-anti-sigma regulatory factor